MTKQSLLYTRKGDAGQTSILEKVRLSKADQRLETIGTLDELNAHLGLAVASMHSHQSKEDSSLPGSLITWLPSIQSDLLAIGSYLAHPIPSPESPITDERIGELETAIDDLDAAAPPLGNFILPGGSVGSAQLHVARAVSRRAERCVVRLSDELLLAPEVLRYTNRLSDLLFAAARAVAHAEGAQEQTWKGSV